MSRDAVKPLFYLPRSSRVTDFHSGLDKIGYSWTRANKEQRKLGKLLK